MARIATRQPIPFLEWLSAALGLAIAIALLVIIGLEAFRGDNQPVPVLTVRVEGIEATQAGHVARLVITNASGRTAARVEVEGESGSQVSRASIDYVPGHSEAEGGLVFHGDPRRSGLRVRVTGYQLP